VFPLKKAISLILSLLLIVGIFAGLPSVSAEEIELPPEVPEESEDFVRQMMESYGCTPAPGGELRASELEPGKSWCFWGDSVELILDTDYACPVFSACGSVTVRGEGMLTTEILYSKGGFDLESGSVVCPVMDNPPESGTTVHNGVTGLGGVSIEGGSLVCPDLSSGGETVSVSGGEVKVDSVSALFGYSQSGGTVDAGYIWAREGFCVSGGELNVGSISAEWVFFKGGVTKVRTLLGIYGPDEGPAWVSIGFPMTVTEPAGARWESTCFVDRSGNPVSGRVRIEQVEVDCPFTDVSENSYCYTPMLWAYYYGVTTGTDETHFSPNSTCTRGQIVTFLWRASGSPEPERTDCPFTDLDLNASYYKAVLWAVEKGVTTGKTDTIFAPKDPCSRAQIVTFLWRSQGSPKPKGWYGEPRFTDVPKKSFYYQALCWAWEEGIAAGTSEKRFSPYRPCTRGQAVTFLMRTFG
jgi:hypothetical protein